MSFQENKTSMNKELDFYDFNESERKVFSNNSEKNPVLTNSAKEKILITCFLVFLIRLGNYIQIPGIDQSNFSELTNSNFIPLGVYNKTNTIVSLLSLGISPSINASIIMQFILAINSDLKKFQREEGEFGRRKIATYTRSITLFLAIIQSFFFVFSLKPVLNNWNIQTCFEICCALTAGAMIVLWISEKITKNGITNGASLLVFLNIIDNTPEQFKASLPYLNFYQLGLLIITLIITIAGVILLQQSIICIPIVTSKLLMQNQDTEINSLKQKSFFPFKLNQAGVMPIVFASYLLPVLKSGAIIFINKINQIFQISLSFPYILNEVVYFGTEFLLIAMFTSFYSLLIIDPKDVSEDLQKGSFFIPGVRPGKETFVFLDKLFQSQSLIGGIILAGNVVFLNFISLFLKLPLLQGIGIGSQIIIVGVTIEVIQKIRALMISEIYQKYLKNKN